MTVPGISQRTVIVTVGGEPEPAWRIVTITVTVTCRSSRDHPKRTSVKLRLGLDLFSTTTSTSLQLVFWDLPDTGFRSPFQAAHIPPAPPFTPFKLVFWDIPDTGFRPLTVPLPVTRTLQAPIPPPPLSSSCFGISQTRSRSSAPLPLSGLTVSNPSWVDTSHPHSESSPLPSPPDTAYPFPFSWTPATIISPPPTRSMNRWDLDSDPYLDPLIVNPPPVIDHSAGRVSVVEGSLFYSPNCPLEVVELPICASESYMFRETAVRLHNFFQPFWWTQPYGWLAFLPIRPSFAGDLFGRLNEFPVIERHSTGYYRLHDDIAQRWLRLENKLVWATTYIKKRYPAISLRPPPPRVFGYTGLYKTARMARVQAHASRDWFVMWMGLLSYHIASSPTPYPSESQDGIPPWIKVLNEEGYPQSWFSGILLSCVASFSPHTQRVGVFLDPFEQPAKYGSPPPRVDWFCRFNVPVWYPWSRKRAAAARNSVFLAPLAPPVHLLQEATTILTSAPSHAAPIDSSSTADPLSQSQRIDVAEVTAVAPDPEQPWRSFFALRNARNKEKESLETVEERHIRLQRTSQPPIKNTVVWKWEWNATFTVRERTRVSKKFNSDILDDYVGQRIYDPFKNEWDVCSEFGDEPDDEYSDDSDLPTGQVPENATDEYLNINPLDRSPSPLPEDIDVADEYPGTRTSDALTILSRHYGFVTPLVELDAGSDDFKDRTRFNRRIGLIDEPIASEEITSLDRAMFRFVDSLAARSPGVDDWDLHDGNRNALVHHLLPFSQAVMKDNTEIFVLSSPSSSSCHWVLGIPRATDLLYAFREISNGSPNIYAVARSLLINGIPFQTLRVLERLEKAAPAKPPSKKQSPIPIRFRNYQFTMHDYAAYLRDRESLLLQPQGRAALLQGGILWRIAMETLGLDVVLEGPSSAVLDRRSGISFDSDDLEPGFQYWEDALTNDQIIMLCGGYTFYTGEGDQIALVSWWPLQSTWYDVGNGCNFGRWTDRNEAWYQKRKAEIAAGTAKPYTSSKWRDVLRGMKDVRLIKNNVETFSLQYLDL